MNTEQEHSTPEDLQHEAEHTRPHKRGSVMIYLVILFAAAFLLLLMSYFMQQRANREAIDDLQKNSSSAVENLENLIQERDRLAAENQTLQESMEQLERESENLRSQLSAADQELSAVEETAQSAQKQLEALTQLNQIRTLYNQYRNREARELLAQYPDLEEQLKLISESMTEEEREIYDPLESYQTLAGWLDPD